MARNWLDEGEEIRNILIDMTGRTHDLAGLTTLAWLVSTQPLPGMTLGTALTAVAANTIGSVLPDFDDASADIWDKVPAGSILGKIVDPLFGHRRISHSLAGLWIAGWITRRLLEWAHGWLVVDINIVWGALMLGYASHLVMDSLTKEGAPWLFPLPWKIRFPPIKAMRITTGKWVETLVVFPGLLILDAYLVWSNYSKWVQFIKLLH